MPACRVAIDTKDPKAADAVLRAVAEAEATEHVLLWSQHMPVLRSFVRSLPDVEVALLRDTFDPEQHDRLLADAEAIGARAVSAHQDAVTPAFIAAAAARGLGVYCWYQHMARQDAKLVEVAAAGLRGVVTDWPAEARAILDVTAGTLAGMCAQCVSKADVVVGTIGFGAYLFKGPAEDVLIAAGVLPEKHPLKIEMRTVNFLRRPRPRPGAGARRRRRRPPPTVRSRSRVRRSTGGRSARRSRVLMGRSMRSQTVMAPQ